MTSVQHSWILFTYLPTYMYSRPCSILWDFPRLSFDERKFFKIDLKISYKKFKLDPKPLSREFDLQVLNWISYFFFTFS